MELSLFEEQQQTVLRNKLRAVKADFAADDVTAYFQEIIVPVLLSVGITQFTLGLYRWDGMVVGAQLTEDEVIPYEPAYTVLVTALQKWESRFTRETHAGNILCGYSENARDWIVLAYDFSAQRFFAPLIEDFWPPFFDYA